MDRYKWISFIACLAFSFLSYAAGNHSPSYPSWKGITASVGRGGPNTLRGGRASLQWQPQILNQQIFSLYFELSAAHWVVNYHTDKSISIAALTPVLRIYYARRYFSPYFEATAGPAYMSRTRLGQRRLGSHWTFQDILGFGTTFGSQHQFDTSFRFLHYSNANLASENGGIDVWFLGTVGYHF